MSTRNGTYIIGAGFTGLGAGLISGAKIFEASAAPGGICASYSKDDFRFEIGGGHWIFGGDSYVLGLMEKFAPCKRYQRASSVYFPGNLDATKKLRGTFVPYPLQNNLYALGKEISDAAVSELTELAKSTHSHKTMAEWLNNSFGETLSRIFFEPFHARYTAGLYKEIAPQDPYKSPFNLQEVINGAAGKPKRDVGYNTTYLYPQLGLDVLAQKLGAMCDIDFGVGVAGIDAKNRRIKLTTGKELEYKNLISSMPLNKTLSMSGVSKNTDPFTSVLVLNLGVELGTTDAAQKGDHWLYIPDSVTGFHRVGYYSNVDPLFLPVKYRDPKKYASLYIEFAFPYGKKPDDAELKRLCKSTVDELTEWGFIKKALVVDPTWIEVAYTWTTQGSTWLKDSLQALAAHNIVSAGRYGRWNFQGIAESLKEGLVLGSTLLVQSKVN